MTAVPAQGMPQRAAQFGQRIQVPLLTAVAYYLGAEVAFLIGTLSDNIFAPFWPPNIVLFCALMLVPERRWWILILAVFPAHVLAELRVGMPAPQMLVAFATNVLVALLNALAVRRIAAGPKWFDSLRETWIYIFITAGASPAAVALAGAFVPILGGGTFENYWIYWAQWYLSNALGFLTLGPISLIWLFERRDFFSPFSFPRLIEAALLSTALIVTCILVFESGVFKTTSSLLPALLYSPLPLVLWAAIRFGARGAAGAILIVTIVLISGALNGSTVFVTGNAETSAFAIQFFLIGLSIPVLLLGSSIDETGRAERAVRESEERMTFAAASAHVCMWHFDYQSDRFWLTDHGREMFGFSPASIITRHAVIRAIHHEDREAALDTMQAAASAGRLADCEFRIIRPDGEIRWLRCRATAHGEYRGAAAEISGTFADITEHKMAESEMVRQRQELTHLTRVSMLGELAGGIAHEITQPLAAIMANAEAARILLTQKSPNLAEVVEVLDDIIEEDNRAGEVIHRLRGLLKKSGAKFEPVNVNDVVSATLQILHNELITRGTKVTVTLARDLPRVAGDLIQLQQVLLNLVLNAIDAMNDLAPSRRVISISTGTTNEGDVQVSVADGGSGLAPTFQELAFQPFFTTKERGLGIGLSLSSSIIRLHGGKLSLDNNSDSGATATFRLPRANVAVAAK
jgi:two-component system, LuxR family, sensor kinase FixL